MVLAIGTWSSRELLAAALCLPWIVGWSGIVDSHVSSICLNWSGVPVIMSLNALGMTLNNCAPLTFMDDSLAFLREAGPFLLRGLTTITLPLLGVLVKEAWYPCTSPWATFQIKIIMYLSLRLSCEYRWRAWSLSQ